MNKDVIYIDTEDDITAIIGKIKDSPEKIVALVPPKRIGVLQSAVNLRLLARMADNSDKRLVLVTSNKALINLSSVAKIPIARNLQSKPELAEIEDMDIDESEDIIDGKQLPVGELARTADKAEKEDEVVDIIGTIDVEKDSPKITPTAPKKSTPSEVKVPDFSKFRKKLFIGIILGLGLAGFLVWAIIFAPAATIIITAKTSPAPVSLAVKLGGTTATDVSKGIIQTVSKQIQKDVSVTFTATGSQNVGNKATGVITVDNCDSSDSFVIAANTVFVSSSNISFSSVSSVTVPGLTGKSSTCQSSGAGAGTVDIPVTAVNAGDDSNITPTSYSITGVSGYIYAKGGQMSGGTTKISTVVTSDDIQKASQALADLSSDSVKQQLIAEFTNGESVVTDSFNVVHAAAVSTPAVGAEATSGKATLTSSTTFSIVAIAKSEIESFLKDAVNKQLGANQRYYSDGIDKVTLSGYQSTDQGATVNIAATGQIGPNINDNSIEQQVKGMQFGDAQALLSAIDGVSNVDIKFPYFWVTSVPNDTKKIDVQFIIQNA
jgi:hypothetical protein